jgi:catechol 2,3-dioxygenase-like lactoylglutathione lyase family enzyme
MRGGNSLGITAESQARENGMILDHIGLAVRDFARSATFFRRALAPLGIQTVLEGEGWAMLGKDGRPEFWIGAHGMPPGPIHIAFAAENREQVRAFHRAALAAGGRDNGAPGIRAKYHPDYYGAFVFDPDGHNIEAVCHRPE